MSRRICQLNLYLPSGTYPHRVRPLLVAVEMPVARPVQNNCTF